MTEHPFFRTSVISCIEHNSGGKHVQYECSVVEMGTYKKREVGKQVRAGEGAVCLRCGFGEARPRVLEAERDVLLGGGWDCGNHQIFCFSLHKKQHPA